MSQFPKDFIFGASISSYQTEGDNFNSDWWQWEKKGKTRDYSGKACDYWNRWKEDHNFLTELGAKAFRLSLEWSRIEPADGQFSQEAIDKYRKILEDLKNRNIKTVVTLWHFSTPIWFQEKYGWHKKTSIEIFTRYVDFVYKELGDQMNIVVVMNEPMIPLGLGFLLGAHPPGFKNPFKFWRALNNLAKAYVRSYEIIHSRQKNALVGITYWYNWFATDLPCGSLILKISRWFRVNWFGHKIKNCQDYFGLDYYRIARIKFGVKKPLFMGFGLEDDPENVMGWTPYPAGIFNVLSEIRENYGNIPIYIMENGLPSRNGLADKKRFDFIREHLKYVAKAIAEGIDVRGYFHWSLLDNFEWANGFEPKFGLIETDFQTLERKPRESFYAYKSIIEKNGID